MTRMMQAMQLDSARAPLRLVERPMPQPGPRQLLVAVAACGVCRTDLHIADGDIHPNLPIVPGHEVVGRVAALGAGVGDFLIGDRIGIPWLGKACGHCPYCGRGDENLCDFPLFTGFSRDGGYASHMVADADFCFRIPDAYDDVAAAPLLCAGLIGYRAYRMTGGAKRLGLYGFGAAAHILAQIAVWEGKTVFAFTRQGDLEGRAFALSLGCDWAGASGDSPPEPMDAAIIFAPAGPLVPEALSHVCKGGRLVCAGIHMSDIPAFPYALLWGERSVRSVANLTREDGASFLELAARAKVRTSTRTYALADANQALEDVRAGAVEGAAVLVMP